MKMQSFYVPAALSKPSLRFVIILRWVIILLAPLLTGLSDFHSTPVFWGVLLVGVAITILMQTRLKDPRGRMDRRIWYVAFLSDLLLFTYIVVLRGGFRTDTYLLYNLVVCEAGLILGTWPAILTGISACILYAVATVGVLGEPDINRLVIRCVYLLLIGTGTALLAAAEKRALVASLTDFKTHVPNFRYFQASLREAVQAYQGNPLCVAILDVDNFKHLNATIGHPLADKVLEQLADLLGRSIRVKDQLARYGGEEFILLLPGTDVAAAEKVMERLRTRVAEHTFRPTADSHPIYITVSVGIAELKSGLTDSQLMVQADRALQQAKRGGKNRVSHIN